jgi:hypothetical protein
MFLDVLPTNVDELNGFDDVVVLICAADKEAKDMACQ